MPQPLDTEIRPLLLAELGSSAVDLAWGTPASRRRRFLSGDLRIIFIFACRRWSRGCVDAQVGRREDCPGLGKGRWRHYSAVMHACVGHGKVLVCKLLSLAATLLWANVNPSLEFQVWQANERLFFIKRPTEHVRHRVLFPLPCVIHCSASVLSLADLRAICTREFCHSLPASCALPW